MPNENEKTLPIDQESFKEDVEMVFSLSNSEIELILNELEKRGVRFNEDDISRVIGLEEPIAFILRRFLTFIIPRIKENKDNVKQELDSIYPDGQKIQFLIDKASVLKEETVKASDIVFTILSYVDYQPHFGGIAHMLNLVPISVDKGEDVKLLPVLQMSIRTHPGGGEDEPEEQISVNIEPRQLEKLIKSLQALLSKVRSETERYNNLLGNKVIITNGNN